jgi:uncharacterized protein (DUF2249 family)
MSTLPLADSASFDPAAAPPSLEPAAPADGHACACNEHDVEVPELDARLIPHAIRHATIFGARGSLHTGGALDLVAPHDPLPLLAQVEQAAPGGFAVDYLERGPEAWRLRFVRQGG